MVAPGYTINTFMLHEAGRENTFFIRRETLLVAKTHRYDDKWSRVRVFRARAINLEDEVIKGT